MDKFQLLQYGRNSELKEDYNYFLGNYYSILYPNEECKDLGIIMTLDGKFNNHINTIYSKVNKKINWILRAFKCRDMDFMHFVWRTYCLPVIDYCS